MSHISYDGSIRQSTLVFRCWCFSIHIDCRVCELIHGHFYIQIYIHTYINKTVSCIYIRLSFLQLHLRCERLKRQCARYLLVQLSETAVCQRLKITRRRHREKHTDFMLLLNCRILNASRIHLNHDRQMYEQAHCR